MAMSRASQSMFSRLRRWFQDDVTSGDTVLADDVQERVAVRDFVYLDVERVKSLLAQLEQGLLTDRTTSRGSTESVTGHAGLSVPAIGAVGSSAEYAWQHHASETRTLHDHIFNQTEALLVRHEKVTRFPEDIQAGRLSLEVFRSQLSPVGYVIVKGRPTISDYNSLSTMLRDINQFAGLFAEVQFAKQLNELKNEADRAVIERLKEASTRDMQQKTGFFQPFASVIEGFYHDRLILRVFPFDEASVRFAAPLRRELLRDRLEDIRFKFGPYPVADWTLFGQIAYMPRETTPEPPPNLTFSSQMESAIEQTVALARNWERMFSVSYPEIAITPIAVYRE
jgi:hypothetical protein